MIRAVGAAVLFVGSLLVLGALLFDIKWLGKVGLFVLMFGVGVVGAGELWQEALR